MEYTSCTFTITEQEQPLILIQEGGVRQVPNDFLVLLPARLLNRPLTLFCVCLQRQVEDQEIFPRLAEKGFKPVFYRDSGLLLAWCAKNPHLKEQGALNKKTMVVVAGLQEEGNLCYKFIQKRNTRDILESKCPERWAEHTYFLVSETTE